MNGIMGDVLYKTKKYELVPDIYFVKYNSNIDPKQLKRMSHFRDLIQKKSCYDKEIVNSEMYLYVIRKIVENLIKAKHQSFIICSTVAQVKLIHDMLMSIDVDSDMLYSKDTEVKKDAQVIVATYGFAGAGFDLKTLSALIYVSPYRGKKSTIQTVGRILRKCEGKQKAVVFDLVDQCCPAVFNGYIASKSKILNSEFGGCNVKELEFN
jgi:superfamily II DNA or RNA helicase